MITLEIEITTILFFVLFFGVIIAVIFMAPNLNKHNKEKRALLNEKLAGTYQQARDAMASACWSTARDLYDSIVKEDKHSWEGLFYSLICKAKCVEGQALLDTVDELNRKLDYILYLGRGTVANKEAMNGVVEEVYAACASLADVVGKRNPEDAAALMYRLGDAVEEQLEASFKPLSVRSWKQGIKVAGNFMQIDEKGRMPLSAKVTVKTYEKKIRKFDDTFQVPY